MAGRTRAARRPAPLIPTSSMVASAVRLKTEVGRAKDVYRAPKAWQREAWRFYDITPEMRFAAGWIANAMSRCLLDPGQLDEDGNKIAATDKRVRLALNSLFGSADGQAEMLRMIGIHLTIVGESYLVGRWDKGTAGPEDSQIWEVVSGTELKQTLGKWVIDYGTGYEPIELADHDTVIRIWQPDPKRRVDATSHIRALLPTLTEIEYLTRHIFKQATSRVAGAGVWLLPAELEFPGSDAPGANKAEGFMKMVGQAMSVSLTNPEDPSSMVPVMATVPGKVIDQVKPPIQFWSEFDAKAVDSRKAAIVRFCIGMDLPPEIIMGMSHNAGNSGGRGTGVSHWGQWQIEEAAIKIHIEPMLEVIGSAIVMQYLRPVSGVPTAALIPNTAALRLQPDRSKEAVELSDRGLLSDEALRRENGFNESDAPDPEQVKMWLLRKIATAAASPEQVGYAARIIAALPEFPMPAGGSAGPQARENTPSTDGHPTRTIPDPAESEAARLLRSAFPGR